MGGRRDGSEQLTLFCRAMHVTADRYRCWPCRTGHQSARLPGRPKTWHLDDFDFLAESGESFELIAARLNLSPAYLEKALRQAGRSKTKGWKP